MKSMVSMACALLVSGSLMSLADAQSYPNRQIRWIAPAAAGSTSDTLARLVAEKLGSELGVAVIVDNRPGAGGNIAADLAAKAPADGYTLLTGTNPLVISPSLYTKLSYDPLKDFAPISLISDAPLVFVVNSTVPVKSVREFIALAKQHPGEFSFSSAGNGTGSHLAGEMFKLIAGVDVMHIPYKIANQADLDVVSGRVTMMINVLPEMLPFIRDGKLQALAITSAKRSAILPDVPTMQEAGVPGYVATSWQGVLAPANTPPAIITTLNQGITKILETSDVRSRMAALGFSVIASTPPQFGQFMKSETEKWAKIVKASGAKID